MFDLNISFASLFSGCFIRRRQFETGKLDLQSINEFICELENPIDKLNLIADYIYAMEKYEVIIITRNHNVIIKRNFNNYKTNTYLLTSIPIFDRDERLLGNLSIGTIEKLKNDEIVFDLVKLLSKILVLI